MIDTGAGLLLIVADGAGNSRNGLLAADAVVALARSLALREPTPDQWSLQELLFEADEAAAHVGGEATAVAAFVREGTVACAAAGDTIIAFLAPTGHEIFPQPRTRYRLGSGTADVQVLTRPLGEVCLVATDGAAACLRFQERLAPHVDVVIEWARHGIERRASGVGDDATVLVIGPA